MTAQLAYSVLSDEQRKRFETTKELDFSFGIKGLSRFRANVFLQRGVVSMAIRQIPYEITAVGEARACRRSCGSSPTSRRGWSS